MLPSSSLTLVIFGIPGSGKNFVGKILEKEEFGFYVYDADEDFSDEMKEFAATSKLIPDELRSQYHEHLLEKIASLRSIHSNLAVVQCLPREHHRKMISELFPGTLFVLIQTSEPIWQQRLQTEVHSFASVDYRRMVAAQFEQPRIPHYVVNNHGDQESTAIQVRILLSKITGV